MGGPACAATVLSLLTAGSAQAASGLALDWSVPERLSGRASVHQPVAAPPASVRLQVLGRCPARPRWRLDGEPVTPAARGRCAFDLPLERAGPHDVELEAGGERLTERVEVRDHLVVSVGDSVASGEGNPEATGPPWLERRCHRSLLSGAAHAALAVERGDPHSAVTFVPLACSGATLTEGLLGEYGGVQPDRRSGPLPPQAPAAVALARAAHRRVDALLVSVGANDVHFGALLRFCMAVRRCDERRFDPRSPGREAPDPAAPTAEAVVRSALGALREGYDELARTLGDAVRPERVIIFEYFDPLRDERGEVCSAALPGVSADESDWAQREILAPLNAEVRAAAERHGWQVVGGVAEAFRAHGICAGGQARWVRRPEESIVRQLQLTGTLHPNGRGHLATAALIAPVLARVVGAQAGSGSAQVAGAEDSEGAPRVHWAWLPVAALAGALACALVLSRRRRRM